MRQDRRRPSENKRRRPRREDKVVRLSVQEDEDQRLDFVEEMPSPVRSPLRPSSAEVDLHEDEVAEAVPAESMTPWEVPEQAGERPTPMGWILLVSVALLGVSLWMVAQFLMGDEAIEDRAGRVDQGWTEEAERERRAEALFDRVREKAEAYLLADTLAEKARFVRHPERVLPLMREYYQRHRYAPRTLLSIEAFQPFAIENKPFIYIAGKVADGEVLHLSMEQFPDGELRFDWESEVAYNPLSFEEFVATKPGQPLNLRVYARLDNFYSYEFSDPERFQALILSERGTDQFLFGYVERGTPEAEQLLALLTPDIKEPKPAVLRVRFLPDTPSRRSVLVEELVSPRWVFPDNPAAGGASRPAEGRR